MQDVTVCQRLIAQKCDELKELLIRKNRQYGNSALEPIRIFADSTADEQIKVRMDDKVNRLLKSISEHYQKQIIDFLRTEVAKMYEENTLIDLAGYIILFEVENELHNKK